jgi:TPR repeat protein
MSKKNPAEEITDILVKHDLYRYLPSHVSRPMAAATDAEKFEQAKWMNYVYEQSWGKMGAEDSVRVKDLLAEIYEDVGSRGNAEAMRYAACALSNGAYHQTIHKNPNGYRISVAPDFERAAEWARKSEALGDPIAAKIRPHIEEDAKRAKAPKP